MADDPRDPKDGAGETVSGARAGPTIDVEVIEVTTTGPAPGDASGAMADRPKPVSPWVIAPFSGLAAAALVIGVGWMLGWPKVEPAANGQQADALAKVQTQSQAQAGAIDGLTGRLAALESKLAKPAAPAADPAVTGRLDGLDKAIAALKTDLMSVKSQADRTAAAVSSGGQAGETAAAPATAAAEPPAPAVLPSDFAALAERLDRIEQTSKSQAAELARDSEKLAGLKPADDLPLRRVITAALLDLAVRQGEPYAALLATARSMASSADALKPLEPFAASGVPSPAALNRELLALLPKLAPPAEPVTTGNGIVDRLQAEAAKLVRIERTETSTGNDRGSVVARITALAIRNDFAEARRELAAMSAADRAPAQAFLDKVAARDAALAAARSFADESMAILAKRPQ